MTRIELGFSQIYGVYARERESLDECSFVG
mgnify:CR=1 FL=1